MKNLVKLFSILQLTKEQPLTGYLTAGIKLSETATLAEHHYTCTLMGYLLGDKIKQVNPEFNNEKLIKMLLVHDLGELFGGDVAGPINRKYPDIRECKDKIGEHTIDLLSSYIDNDEFKTLFFEFENKENDEAMVAKIIDQIDHQYFLEHHSYKKRYARDDFDYRPIFTENHIYNLPDNIQHEATRHIMKEFLKQFQDDIYDKGYQAMTFLMK